MPLQRSCKASKERLGMQPLRIRLCPPLEETLHHLKGAQIQPPCFNVNTESVDFLLWYVLMDQIHSQETCHNVLL